MAIAVSCPMGNPVSTGIPRGPQVSSSRARAVYSPLAGSAPRSRPTANPNNTPEIRRMKHRRKHTIKTIPDEQNHAFVRWEKPTAHHTC
ncbi:secreted protein [Moniliophthora roreri]|nr:secreted protein [Moniliophthora roreri]